jgi:hypothetical protein
MVSTLTALLLALSAGRDTTIMLGQAERDLTGDGKPEVLQLVGTGKTVDSLDVVLSISSNGAILYRTRLAPITRRVGFDADRRMRSRPEHRAFLAQFGGWFFHKDKFLPVAEFIAAWRTQAPGRLAEVPENIARDGGFLPDSARAQSIWREIQDAAVTIFEFSAGGDAVTALGWSARTGRFYRLIECC